MGQCWIGKTKGRLGTDTPGIPTLQTRSQRNMWPTKNYIIFTGVSIRRSGVTESPTSPMESSNRSRQWTLAVRTPTLFVEPFPPDAICYLERHRAGLINARMPHARGLSQRTEKTGTRKCPSTIRYIGTASTQSIGYGRSEYSW